MNRKLFTFLLFIILFNFTGTIAAQTIIPMEENGGVYKVPCKINGLKLKFIFDTGASAVSISSSVAQMMLDNDYLKQSDIKESGQSQIANGSIIEHTKINLHTLEIGNQKLHNVEAIVIHDQSAPLLLGQSAIQKLGEISISGNNLIIEDHSSQNNKYVTYSPEQYSAYLNEAQNLFFDKNYIAAVEIFDKLKNDHLNIEDISYYAECLYRTERYKEALNYYICVVEWIKRFHDEANWDLGSIYSTTSLCAYHVGNYSKSIMYANLAQHENNIISAMYRSATFWKFCSYRDLGKKVQSCSVIVDYIEKYTNYMDISITDCWTKQYTDPNIADFYYYLALACDINDYEKYLIISAAWGNKDAQEDCKKYNLSYNQKPERYVY